MSTSASLSAAADDRKARLAQLRSLKRKEPPTANDDGARLHGEDILGSEPVDSTNSPSKQESRSPSPSITNRHLSGRNYDPETRGPKLGFENAPTDGQATLELQAKALADATKQQAEEEERSNKPLDLFKLQPKKPNWDLKRDLDRKLEILNVRTENAIAKLVRERIQRAQKEAEAKGQGGTDGEAVGMEGTTLVEAMHMKEREEEEDERRERAEEEGDEEDGEV